MCNSMKASRVGEISEVPDGMNLPDIPAKEDFAHAGALVAC